MSLLQQISFVFTESFLKFVEAYWFWLQGAAKK